MSLRLINLSPDLKRLRDEGYFIQIRNGFLIMREVPYVDPQRHVRTGTLISSLALAGDVAQRPETHIAFFDGECPCGADGWPLHKIINSSELFDLGGGIAAKHRF